MLVQNDFKSEDSASVTNQKKTSKRKLKSQNIDVDGLVLKRQSD